MPSSYQQSFDFTSAVTVTLWTTVPFGWEINWIDSKNRCLKENVFDFVPERERISAMEQLFTDQISNSQSTLLYSSVHAQAVIGDKCPFSLQPLQNKQTLLWGGHSPPTLPTPQWGESQISRHLKKERILSLAGGRTRSTGRYPERERTFSQKHSEKNKLSSDMSD